MSAVQTVRSLDLRGRTITTFIVYAVHRELTEMQEGERVEVVTDAFPAIDADIRAWCRTTGNALVDIVVDDGHEEDLWRFVIEKGSPWRSGRKLAALISDDGLFELLAPLGFALAAGLEGHDVALYFQGPAVRVLATGHVAKMHGPGRPFSRFPRAGLAKAGHIPPQEKVGQLLDLGAKIFACGSSMQHFRVDPSHLAFDGVIVAEYLTFMEQMGDADIHMTY
ncbi:MAG: DsrE family protein [Acidimicrobiia bacterium]|nr:DsrE family protein [Acidimicrobiia bacterium]